MEQHNWLSRICIPITHAVADCRWRIIKWKAFKIITIYFKFHPSLTRRMNYAELLIIRKWNGPRQICVKGFDKLLIDFLSFFLSFLVLSTVVILFLTTTSHWFDPEGLGILYFSLPVSLQVLLSLAASRMAAVAYSSLSESSLIALRRRKAAATAASQCETHGRERDFSQILSREEDSTARDLFQHHLNTI